MGWTGVVLWRGERLDAEEITRFARRVEDAGLASLWVPETWVRDAGIQLALAAQATRTLRLGAGILNIYGRSPGFLAQTAAELDVLSGGRFILGIGVSGRAVIEGWHAQPFRRPLQRTRETLAALRQAFAGERVEAEGEFLRMRGFRLRRGPVQERVPIYLAANGPRNTRLAGELADGWIPFLIPFSRFREAMAPLAEGARAAGRAPGAVDAAPFIYFSPGEDLARARERVMPELGFYVGAMGVYYHAQLARWGYAGEADRIRAAWGEGGRAAAARAVPDALVDDLALCGPPSRLAEGLARLREAGITHPILRLPETMEEEEAAAALDLIGKLG